MICIHMRPVIIAFASAPLAIGFPTVDHGSGHMCRSLMNVSCSECKAHATHEEFWREVDDAQESADHRTWPRICSKCGRKSSEAPVFGRHCLGFCDFSVPRKATVRDQTSTNV